MVMTDVSGSVERADALGKLGVSYGVGMVVGPMIGGYMTSHFSEQIAAGVAASICLAAIGIVWLFVPRSTKDLSRLGEDKSKQGERGSSHDQREWLKVRGVRLEYEGRLTIRGRGSR